MGIDEISSLAKIGRHFVRVKKFSISPRAILTIYTRERRARMAQFFSKNRFFGTTHGDKPTSQNGISLRSPSLIMAPGLTEII